MRYPDIASALELRTLTSVCSRVEAHSDSPAGGAIRPGLEDPKMLRITAATIAFSVLLIAPSESDAQFNNQNQAQKKNAQPEKPENKPLKGTLKEIKKKGRAFRFVLQSEAGGEPVELPITPKIQFAVEAKGDAGFLKERQIASGTAVLTNKMLFVKNWYVHVGPAARKIRPFIRKADKKVGQSVNSYDLAGTILGRQASEDFPEYETLKLNISNLRGQPVFIDKGATVTVQSSDPSMAKEGSPVEIYQVPAPGNRFRIAALKVLLKEPIKSEDYFAEIDNKKKKR